jgi:hypothetical protein
MGRWDSMDPVRLADRTFEQRMSRRQALRNGALAAGAVATLSAADVAPALASWGRQPRPIPGGFDESFNPVPKDPAWHFFPPYLGFEMGTITDFKGVIAAGESQGLARGSDGRTYSFDTDMRFMQGTYVGKDGRRRRGSFGFI